MTEDTVYAYLYIPGTCPRCESSLNVYSKALKDIGKKMTLITVMEDKYAASFYNKKKKYAADHYIYDTDNVYKRIFNFNNAGLGTTYMLKISKTGRLITGYNCMLFTKELFNELVARAKPLEYKKFYENGDDDSSASLYPVSEAGAKNMDGYKDYRLNVPQDIQLCELFRNPYFTDSIFFYPDELIGGTLLFRQKHDSDEMLFEKILEPTDKEKLMFVRIDSADFKFMSQMNGVHYIICNSWPLDNDHIGLSYSLPHMVYNKDTTSVDYYNEPCILSRRLPELSVDSFTALDFDKSDDFFYKHFQFSSTGNKIILGCQKKTWPMSYEPDEYKDNVRMNPFDKGFYDKDNPFMASFDRRTDKLIQRFGHIDELARKTFTGYYFVSPLSVTGGNELAYTDSYSGKVYVADTSDLAKETACYEVFRIDDKLLPEADTTKFYSYDCMRPYMKFFCRKISDMRIMPDKLYCVVKYSVTKDVYDENARHTFVIIDRKTGIRNEYLYPGGVDSYNVFGRGIRVLGNRAYPFEILKREQEALLRIYNVTQ